MEQTNYRQQLNLTIEKLQEKCEKSKSRKNVYLVVKLKGEEVLNDILFYKFQ
jgi:hypothetical protein